MGTVAIKNAYGYTGPELANRAPAGLSLKGVLTALRRAPLALVERVLLWQKRMDERARLGRLDERLLRDMGMSKADAYRETGKPFWRA